jgi:hypothetical protein
MEKDGMSSPTDVSSQTPPSNGHVQEVIRSAQHELNHLLRQRAETMKRIGTVKQTLVYLAKIFGDDVLTPEVLRLIGRAKPCKQPGFTRGCRAVLMEAGMPLEARQGVLELQRKFPELVERQKNPLASVTTVFNRLVASAEVRSFSNARGRRVWEWITDPSAAEVAPLSSADDLTATSPEVITKQ